MAVEIDRCATDAIASVTGCSPGKRNLRIHDYGTVAETFLDTRSGQAVRVLAREPAREEAPQWGPAGLTSYRQQAIAYRRMPDEALFEIRAVRMEPPDRSRPPRQACDACGETVNFGRYVSEGRRTAASRASKEPTTRGSRMRRSLRVRPRTRSGWASRSRTRRHDRVWP